MYQIKAGEATFDVNPTSPNEGTINEQNYTLDITLEDNGFHIIKDNKSYSASVVSSDYDSKTFEIMVNGNVYTLEAKDRFDILLKELGMENLNSSAVNDLKAPMPGLVLATNVKAGDAVKKGDALLILEAMKMENVLKASSDATIKSVNAEIGKAVEKNEVLIEFE